MPFDILRFTKQAQNFLKGATHEISRPDYKSLGLKMMKKIFNNLSSHLKGTCAIIRVEYCMYILSNSATVSYALWDL